MKTNFTYFNNCKTLQDVKIQFRVLAKKYHPDMLGGNSEIFKIINNEYDFAFKFYQDLDNKNIKADTKTAENKKYYNYEKSSIYKNIIEKLIRYDIDIEMVGSWIWIDKKNTYPILDILHELKFTWAKSKKKWYWFDGIENQSFKYKSKNTYEEIKNKYGSVKIDTDPLIRI